MDNKEFTETPLEDVLDVEMQETADPDIIEETPAEPEAVETVEEPVTEEKEHSVPLKALLSERDEVKALKAEIEAIKAAHAPKEPQAIPDPIDDPEGFAAYQGEQQQKFAQTMQGQLYSQKLGMSEFQYAQQHGQEAAKQLVEWFGTQPQHVQLEAQQHPHPFAFAHELKQRAEITEKFSNPDMLEKFEAFLANDGKPAPKAPKTTVGARTLSERGGPQWAGPTPLEEILPD